MLEESGERGGLEKGKCGEELEKREMLKGSTGREKSQAQEGCCERE